jgi:hypothetical protein
VQARDGAAHAPERGAVRVGDGQLAVHAALVADGRLHLRVREQLVVQLRPVAVHLRAAGSNAQRAGSRMLS